MLLLGSGFGAYHVQYFNQDSKPLFSITNKVISHQSVVFLAFMKIMKSHKRHCGFGCWGDLPDTAQHLPAPAALHPTSPSPLCWRSGGFKAQSREEQRHCSINVSLQPEACAEGLCVSEAKLWTDTQCHHTRVLSVLLTLIFYPGNLLPLVLEVPELGPKRRDGADGKDKPSGTVNVFLPTHTFFLEEMQVAQICHYSPQY